MAGVEKRLHAAIYDHWKRPDGKAGSMGAFQKAMAERLPKGERGGGSGTSYQSIKDYVSGKKEPNLAFLRQAASLLGVRTAWLAVGEGKPTQRSQDEWLQYRVSRITRSLNEESVSEFVAGLGAGADGRATQRREAVLRFARRLHDAESPGVVWFDVEERQNLLDRAMEFLVQSDGFFASVGETAESPAERLDQRTRYAPLLGQSGSLGWYVTWADAVLDLFARRVYGLGIRSATLWDQHAPAASLKPLPESIESWLLRLPTDAAPGVLAALNEGQELPLEPSSALRAEIDRLSPAQKRSVEQRLGALLQGD